MTAPLGPEKFNPDHLGKLLGPTRATPGGDITFTNFLWTVVDRAGKEAVTKGVLTTSGLIGSVLNVHLVNDYDASGVKEYTAIPLVASDRVAVMFDEIKDVGTDINYAALIVALD